MVNMSNSTQLTILFWNVWMETQFTATARIKLFEYLDKTLTAHNPTVIGINEVIYDETLERSFLLEYFESKGYHTHFTPFSPITKRYTIGSGFMSKTAPSVLNEHVLGPDLPAQRRGFTGCEVKAIEATLPVGKTDITIMVGYLAHLVPLNWHVHQQHYRRLHKLLSDERFNKNFILVGDLNEPKYHPNIMRLSKRFKRKTGTFFSPTWRLHGKRQLLARANYDNVLWSETGLELQDFQILKGHPSDHAPLMAAFKVV